MKNTIQYEFMSLKDGSYKNSPVNIDALIVYPEKGKGPYPILVFNHSILVTQYDMNFGIQFFMCYEQRNSNLIIDLII